MTSFSMARYLLIFLLGGLVGWFASHRVPMAEPGSGAGNAATGAAPAKIQHPRTLRDFADWADQHAADLEPYGVWYTSRSAELSAWPVEKLRAALNQGVSDPGVVLPMGNEAKALFGLFTEFSKRDPDAAWAWLQALPSEAMRGALGPGLANVWPAHRAEEGIAMVMAHRECFESGGGYGYGTLSIRAFESAATRGPAAVDALLVKLREQRMQIPYSHIEFPDNFDFAALADTPGMKALLQKNPPAFFIDSWMIREPQAAMDFLFDLNRAQGKDIATSLFAGMSHSNRKEQDVLIRRTRAVAARTGSLTPEDRQAVISAAAKVLVEDANLMREFSAGISDEAVRSEANLAAARVRIGKDTPAALEFIAASGPPEKRVELLEEILAGRTPNNGDFLSGKSEAAVRKTLADWNTPPERIDALITTLKTSPR